jgi:hypothetical protein
MKQCENEDALRSILYDAVKDNVVLEINRHHAWTMIGTTDVKALLYLVELNTKKLLVDPYDDGYEILSGYCPNCGLEQENPSDQHCVDCGQKLKWNYD